MKKIALITTLLAVGFLSFLLLKKMSEINENRQSIFWGIPASSDLFFVVDDAISTQLKLTENSLVWKDLKQQKTFANAYKQWQKISSALPEDVYTNVLLTRFKTGGSSDWLVLAPSTLQIEAPKIVKTYKKIDFEEISTTNHTLYACEANDILYLATNLSTIQEIINLILLDDFLNLEQQKIDVKTLSDADFYMAKKEGQRWQTYSGFIQREAINIFSSEVETASKTPLRLAGKLPPHMLCEVIRTGVDSVRQNAVLSGEMATISSGSEQALLVGLSRSLKYSILADHFHFDSLNTQHFWTKKEDLTSLINGALHLDHFRDTIFGIEDVDFAVFASNKSALQNLYADIKHQESIADTDTEKKLYAFKREHLGENLSIVAETHRYLPKNNKSVIKYALKQAQKEQETPNEQSYLWKSSFKQKLAQIFTIKNHRTDVHEVLVQDVKNRLYLLDINGKIKWSIPLDGQIIGDIQQVDIYKNGKLQMLFNTASKVYLIDVLGRKVEQFPVSLPQKATNQIAVFDYANTKDYRFMVATTNGLYNYNSEGKKVDGFAFVKPNLAVKYPLVHTTISNIDYIMFNDSYGRLYFLDRRGNERHQTSATLKGNVFSTFKKGLSISTSSVFTLNGNGRLSEYTLAAKSFAQTKDSSILEHLEATRIKEAKQYLLGFWDRGVNIYTSSGGILKEISCDFSPKTAETFMRNAQDGYMLIQAKTNEVYIYDLFRDKFLNVLPNITKISKVLDFDKNSKLEFAAIQNEKEVVFYTIK